ncbi:hypothetical protein BZG21_39410, partial [Escherichia coli]|nr:hypothetical protein [Escherichia coli]
MKKKVSGIVMVLLLMIQTLFGASVGIASAAENVQGQGADVGAQQLEIGDQVPGGGQAAVDNDQEPGSSTDESVDEVQDPSTGTEGSVDAAEPDSDTDEAVDEEIKKPEAGN